jgi:hypothetical protein
VIDYGLLPTETNSGWMCAGAGVDACRRARLGRHAGPGRPPSPPRPGRQRCLRCSAVSQALQRLASPAASTSLASKVLINAERSELGSKDDVVHNY